MPQATLIRKDLVSLCQAAPLTVRAGADNADVEGIASQPP
jgi:hypothetical protein